MSPNKNYEAGRRFEWQRMKVWRELGYEVLRTAGSHGAFDIIAYRPGGHVNFIQCKRVESESQAEKMIAEWRFSPPTQPSKFYHQVLEVYVKATRKVESAYV